MFGQVVKKGKHKTSLFTDLTKPWRNKDPYGDSTTLINLVNVLYYKDFHDWYNLISNNGCKKVFQLDQMRKGGFWLKLMDLEGIDR